MAKETGRILLCIIRRQKVTLPSLLCCCRNAVAYREFVGQ